MREDILNAVTRFGEKAGMFLELTLKDAHKYYGEIQEAIEAKNAEDVGLAAHALKSVLKQNAAEDSAAIVLEMEHAGKENDFEKCLAQKPLLDEEIAKVFALLDDIKNEL